MSAIASKRAHDPPAAEDGRRVLVDRPWPRGVRREDLATRLLERRLAKDAT